jgi:AcrR family transcriptional regulator
MESADAAMALLWGAPAQPRRGPRPALTLDAIARAGIEIADADGLAAVTMQRVADGLNVTKMALYRYVPGKTELVALMVEIGVGGPPERHDARQGWRSALEDWSRSLFTRFRRHPWALEATVGARVMGPNELGWMEHALAALAGTGLDGGQQLDVVVTLVGHVRNLAAQVAAIADPEDAPERVVDSALSALVRDRADRFPALTAALASAVAHGSQNQALDFGLKLILDGVGALLATRP